MKSKELVLKYKDLTNKDLKKFQNYYNLSDIDMSAIFRLALIDMRALLKDNKKKILPKLMSRMIYLYHKYPTLNPAVISINNEKILEIYKSLGFDENSYDDKKYFGDLMGISVASVYRLLNGSYGTNTTKILRYLESISHLNFKQIKELISEQDNLPDNS